MFYSSAVVRPPLCKVIMAYSCTTSLVVPSRRRVFNIFHISSILTEAAACSRTRSAGGGPGTCVGRERRTRGRTANTESALSRIFASSSMSALGGLDRGRRMLDLRALSSSEATA
ncbi:unnamed protein product [Macrosiphum euphorbiae]|nr:unnamed protein product [Macrosiphum euphorbiae]